MVSGKILQQNGWCGVLCIGHFHLCDLSRLLDDLVGFDASPFVFGLLPMMLGSFGMFWQGSGSCCFLSRLGYCEERYSVACPADWISCDHRLCLFHCLFLFVEGIVVQISNNRKQCL